MRLSSLLCSILITILCSLAFAAEPNSTAATVSFPYLAEVTSTDVYIRSGPGTNYYRCGKLNAAEKVQVVGSENSWSKIIPPAGCFSWISTKYVSLDPNNPGQGAVTGDDVNVRAGSDYVEPIHSTTLQLKLGKGAKVQLLGEEKDEYYKISPPKGAYLWVSSEFLKNIGLVAAAASVDINIAEPNAAPKRISVESEMLKEYRQLTKQVSLERAKPASEQDWADIKAKLAAIADNNDAGKAAKYAALQLENVKGYELATTSGKELQQQHAQLSQSKEQIEKAHQAELAKLGDLGKYAIVGKLRPSLLYAKSSKEYRYLILGENNKIVAYALPADSALGIDMTQFFGKKVGLVGKIETDPQTSSTLIRFTEVVEMK